MRCLLHYFSQQGNSFNVLEFDNLFEHEIQNFPYNEKD
jgi:hypothetical protein